MTYSSTAKLQINDHSALFELAKMHRDRGIYDVSCAVTGEEKAVYRSFFKLDFGWSTNQVKAAIVKLKSELVASISKGCVNEYSYRSCDEWGERNPTVDEG